MARTLRTKPALAQVEYARDADNGSGRSPAAVRAATAVAPDTAPEGEPAPGAFDGISKPQPKSPAQRVLKGHIDVVEWPRIEGWVFAPEMPNGRIRLELAEGGDRLQTVVASAGRPDIVTAGVGDGLHGFEIDLHDSELA